MPGAGERAVRFVQKAKRAVTPVSPRLPRAQQVLDARATARRMEFLLLLWFGCAVMCWVVANSKGRFAGV